MAVEVELVALGMAAEIVVIVENEDAALGRMRAMEVRCREDLKAI